MTTIEALKNLAVTLGCAKNVDAVKGTTSAEVIQFIADNYTTPSAKTTSKDTDTTK